MTPDSVSAPAEAPAPVRPRTRPPSHWTDLYLVVTAIFGVWGVGLFLLTLLAIIEPQFFYTDQKAFIKAAGATVVALLALSQAFTMYAAMGLIPTFGVRMKYLMRGHRYGGRIAIALAVVIAWFCMTDIGAPSSPLRAAIHGFFGSTSFAALALKLGLIRFRPEVAWSVAPWLGRYVVGAFLVIWFTSAWAFYTGSL